MSTRKILARPAERAARISLPARVSPRDDRPIAPGDIRIARLGPELRLVLVLSAPDGHVCQVALASNEFEMATDQDLRLTGREAGLAYPLLIESDVTGPLRPDRIGGVLGRIEQPLLALFNRAATDGLFANELDGRRGLPLGAFDEPRRVWKDAEGQLFDSHMIAPAEMDIKTFVDPAVFSGRSTSGDKSLEALVLGILEGRLSLGPRSRLAVVELARQTSSTRPWMMDAARCLTKTALRDVPERTSRGDAWKGPRRRFEDFSLEALLADVLESAALHADVLTVRRAWAAPFPKESLELVDNELSAAIHLLDCSEFVRGYA